MLSSFFSASNLIITLLVTLHTDASVVVNGTPYSVDSIITRDVAIIGGGATGSYSATRLEDLGKTVVVVVEEQDRLGGHTQTYHDPKTGGTIDYGVVVWHNLDIVRNFFARLNVSLVTDSFADTGTTQYTDFQT
jgi:phytoene dehydrogenase-like protein